MDEGGLCLSLSYPYSPVPFWTLTFQGGNAIWGNSTHAPDDCHSDDADESDDAKVSQKQSHGELIAFREFDVAVEDTNMTANEASAWILRRTPASFQVGLLFP